MLEPDKLTSYLSGLSNDQIRDMLAKLDRTNQGHSMFRGVAHDLSNASQALSMGAPAVQAGDIEAEKWLSMTHWVDEKMNRAAAVARDFGTLGADEEHPVSVHEVVSTVFDWQQLQRAQPVGNIQCQMAPHMRPVRASDRRLRQILLALIANSKESIEDQQEAKILLEANPTDGGVTIAVEDSGSGIDPDIRAKVFDPFFTTKEPELHVGLGLTVAHASAESWGGSLTIDEPKGGGTRAELLLPYWSNQPSTA